MIFYWFILLTKGIGWLFRLPPVAFFAERNEKMQCPVCGKRDGRLRCVLVARPGPVIPGRMPDGNIMCQHRCNRCGARWHEKPLDEKANRNSILPSVPRDELEKTEDRQANLQAELSKPETMFS